MKNNLCVNILFILMVIPLVFLSVNFYLGSQEDAIERYNDHALGVIFGRLFAASIVLLFIIFLCLAIELFINIYRKKKARFYCYIKKALYMYSIGICYALVLLLYEFISTGLIAQNILGDSLKYS